MKSFDDVINGNLNEGLAETWKNRDKDANLGLMLLDIMKKLDDIENKLLKQMSIEDEVNRAEEKERIIQDRLHKRFEDQPEDDFPGT
jgi:hypothetical protein